MHFSVEKLSSHGLFGKLPSLNGLKAFHVAARHLNLRLAAEELGVTQGAVAQQVRELAGELGVTLFERLLRTLALTGEPPATTTALILQTYRFPSSEFTVLAYNDSIVL